MSFNFNSRLQGSLHSYVSNRDGDREENSRIVALKMKTLLIHANF